MVKGFCRSLNAITLFDDSNKKMTEAVAGNMEIQFTEKVNFGPTEKIVAGRVDIDICSLPVKMYFVVYDKQR